MSEEARYWKCDFCGFIYDAKAGLLEEDIAPGTPWSAIPEDFCCPECGAYKADFRPNEE